MSIPDAQLTDDEAMEVALAFVEMIIELSLAEAAESVWAEEIFGPN